MIAQLLRQHATARPHARWLSMLEGDELRTLTFGEAWVLVQRRADSLARLGVESSHRVALAPRNDFKSVLTALASLTLGAHVWMVNPDDPPERLRRQLAARQPDLVLGEIEGATALPADQATAPERAPVQVAPSDPAFLFNTSGSTGVPKAVVQSNAAVLSNAISFSAHHELAAGRAILGFLPIHHVNAVHSNLMASLSSGTECVLLRPDSLLRLHRWIESIEPYMVSSVPSAAEALLTSWRRPRVPDSLHHVLTAAAPLSASTASAFHERFGRRIVQGYGLSETMNFSTTLPIDLDDALYSELVLKAERPSVGHPLPGVDVEVRDASGVPVPAGVVGEIHVRGDHLMTGYDGDPEATAQALIDGWFSTGDLGFFKDVQGAGPFFFLTGRAKNIVKVGGEQIALEEVENALVTLPGVRDAACCVEVEPRWGERIVAGVVSSCDVDPQALRGGLAKLVPACGIPSRFVALERVPRATTGKIQRTELPAVLGEGAGR